MSLGAELIKLFLFEVMFHFGPYYFFVLFFDIMFLGALL